MGHRVGKHRTGHPGMDSLIGQLDLHVLVTAKRDPLSIWPTLNRLAIRLLAIGAVATASSKVLEVYALALADGVQIAGFCQGTLSCVDRRRVAEQSRVEQKGLPIDIVA